MGQRVNIPAGPSTEIPVTLYVNDDSYRECNETFTLELISHDALLVIDPGRNLAVVTIIDNDGLLFASVSIYFYSSNKLK